MGFGDSPLVSVIANAIRRVVLPPEERSNEAIQLPAGTVSAEVAGSVKKQAKEPVVNGIPIPPPLPFVVLSVFAPKQSSGLIIESTLRKEKVVPEKPFVCGGGNTFLGPVSNESGETKPGAAMVIGVSAADDQSID